MRSSDIGSEVFALGFPMALSEWVKILSLLTVKLISLDLMVI